MTSARGLRQVPERFQDALGARFLDHCDHDGEVREDKEDQGFAPVAERQVDDPASDQQGEHRLAQNLEHDSQGRAAVRSRKFVVAFGLQPRLSFGFAEAAHAAHRSHPAMMLAVSHEERLSAKQAEKSLLRVVEGTQTSA